MADKKIRVTVWNEFVHELEGSDTIKKFYPQGIHTVIGDALKKNADMEVRYATLRQPEHGLTKEVVDSTDVLLWWGHMCHGAVEDAIVQRVHQRVLEGMGILVLHSGHYSKIFQKLMGTPCGLTWREYAEKERIWCVNPSHPIAEGIPVHF